MPLAPSAEAAQLNFTARIQALLNSPVNGVVNLPTGTFTISTSPRQTQIPRDADRHVRPFRDV
jgi:hypothetical protein